MGQPPRLRTAIGLETGYAFKNDNAGWRMFGNVTPRGKFPHLGIDLMSLELGGGYGNDEWFGDIGYYVRIPYFRLGAEFRVPDDSFSAVFTLQYALRRGGIFGGGEELRVDYRTRGNSLLVGVVFNEPFRKYRKTRPVKKYTDIPRGHKPAPSDAIESQGIPADLEQSIAKVEHAVEWLDRLLTPRFVRGDVEENAIAYRDHIRIPGHTFLDEDSTYHAGLSKAFALALDGDRAGGDELARLAETTIFEQILVPYNHLFGAHKKPRLPTGYINRANEVFDSLVTHLPRFDRVNLAEAGRQTDLTHEVFRRTVVAIEEAADESRRRWKTTSAFWLQRAQFVWLPLNYGLRPDQYDTQNEWDTIISKLTGQSFTDCNNIEYLVNEQFHPHLKRMINETELYHVLIIHDFQEKTAAGENDRMSWDMVTDGYMRALTNAVKAIDRGERDKLPQYLLYIDQNFYVVNKSYDIITYLENIYTTDTVSLKDSTVEASVNAAHREMIATIQASPTFGGLPEDELAKLFKVHVSVTNPWDPTFAMDISMRDHRKFAFRDVFEDDPGSGVGILTGTGVGQHYQPPTWEDRAMVIKGPALLELKHAARELCENQGFDRDEIPEFLRDRPLAKDYEQRCKELWEQGWRAPILVAFNDTGFGKKIATVMRAAIYNLAPKGGVLVAIDSLWLSDYWAGMFISAALRGAHVYGIAPSPVNAPAAAAFMMFLAYENMGMMFEARSFFADDIEPVNGRIHVGFYNHEWGVDDPVKRGSAILEGHDKNPFIREDFPFSQSVFDLVKEYVDEVVEAAQARSATSVVEGDTVKPFLHMKTQFFGTAVGMRALGSEEWVHIVRRYIEIRQQQIAGQESDGLTPQALTTYDPEADQSTTRTDYEDYLETLPPEMRDNHIYAFTIGSMNQDRRGMISDGEVLACISDYPALIGVLDMSTILVTSAYPKDAEEYKEVFPKPDLSTTLRKLTRYLQDVF
jgi:hypothetical protein